MNSIELYNYTSRQLGESNNRASKIRRVAKKNLTLLSDYMLSGILEATN